MIRISERSWLEAISTGAVIECFGLVVRGAETGRVVS